MIKKKFSRVYFKSLLKEIGFLSEVYKLSKIYIREWVKNICFRNQYNGSRRKL